MKYQAPYGVADTNPDAGYVNGDPTIGRKGSIPPAAAFENPQRELVNLIDKAGQLPTDDDMFQVTRAIRDGRLNYCLDTGLANNVEVTLSPTLAQYTAGLTLRVLIAHSCTGPSTLTIGNLNPTSIKRRDGAELSAGDTVAGQIATLVCDGTYFQLQNMGAGEGTGEASIYQVDIPYVHDTGTANHLIGTYSPALPNINEGRTVEIKLANNVTGPTDFTPNNFTTHPVAHPDGSPIKAGDGVINQIWLLCFDGVQWQLLGVYFSTVPASPAGPIAGSGRSLQFRYGPWPGAAHIQPPGSPTHFVRTPAMNTNRQVWTVSFFVRSLTGRLITSAYDGNGLECWFACGYDGSGGTMTGMMLGAFNGQNSFALEWNHPEYFVAGPGVGFMKGGVFTDTKWHHFVLNADGSNYSLYMDSILVSQGATGGQNGSVNSTQLHTFGCEWARVYGSTERFAEFVLIDGQCLSWDKFANNVGGTFIPKDVTGLNFGPNGSYLNFSDASSVTTTTLGKDYSGNGNNWQPVNFVTTDVMTDYPMVTSANAS